MKVKSFRYRHMSTVHKRFYFHIWRTTNCSEAVEGLTFNTKSKMLIAKNLKRTFFPRTQKAQTSDDDSGCRAE